jgi:hypothetical protein
LFGSENYDLGGELVFDTNDTTYLLKIADVLEDFHYQSLRRQVEPLVLVFSDRQDFMEFSLVSDDLPQTIAKIDALGRE